MPFAFLKNSATASPGKQRLIIPGPNPINALAMGSNAKSAGPTPDEFRKLL